MKKVRHWIYVGWRWTIVLVVVSACVDQIDFESPSPQSQWIVEGFISTDPGGYTVYVSQGLELDADSVYRRPAEDVSVVLFDDEGNQEIFSEVEPGTYRTAGLIRGEVGHSYHIRVETASGKVFESAPEKIHPVGEVLNIRHELEERTEVRPFGEFRADVFNIYVDADAGPAEENYVRWKFSGTYKVLTFPEFHMIWLQGDYTFKDPLPCSGYIVVGGPMGSGGILKQIAECTCCTCWVAQYENMPQLSDTQFISNGEFRNIKVAEVPINTATFHEKYRVEVEQMSLTRAAFDFFKLVRDLKADASSLFQPPAGKLVGNIKATNSDDNVVGIFWATAISRSSVYLYPSDVPYTLAPIDFSTDACTDYYDNATTVKPEDWE